MSHRLIVLALPGVITFDLSCAIQVFAASPAVGPEHYRFAIASSGARRIITSDGLTLTAQASLGALADADTVVVPGYRDADRSAPSPAVCRALTRAHARGARIVSFCEGAFALGHAGLLDHRRATTHWESVPALAAQFPLAHVDPAPLYIDAGSVLTSAGMAAALDLGLHVVRRDHGATVAAELARWIVLAPHRDGGQAQFIPRPLTSASETRLDQTQAWALEHLDQALSLTDLAAHAHCSERTLTRRFRAETGTSPKEWLLRMRLLRARELLESTSLSIEQVAAQAGFPSANALRARFSLTLGTSPTAYRRRFRTEATGAAPATAGQGPSAPVQ